MSESNRLTEYCEMIERIDTITPILNPRDFARYVGIVSLANIRRKLACCTKRNQFYE